MTDSAQEEARKAGLYVSTLAKYGRARVEAMVALYAHSGPPAGARSLREIDTGVFDVRLRYDGTERAARWKALTDHTDPTIPPHVYEALDSNLSACKDTVHALVQIWGKYALAPEAALSILDLANPSWLTGYEHAGALALLFPSVAETRAWAAHGTTPSMDDALFLIGLRTTTSTEQPA